MSHYLYIKRTWLISPAARRVWRTCAWFSMLLLPWIYLYGLYGDWLYGHQVLDRLGYLLLLISAISTAANMAAMEYYLFTIDDSRALAQILWFAVLFLAPVGAAIYCLTVYSRSRHFTKASGESPSTLAAHQR